MHLTNLQDASNLSGSNYVSFSCWGMEGRVGVLIFHVIFLGCKVLQSSVFFNIFVMSKFWQNLVQK